VNTAIILPPTEASFLEVAGLPVIQRIALAALRGGFDRVVALGGTATARLRQVFDSDVRTRAVEIADGIGSLNGGRAAVIPSDCVLTAATLQRILSARLDGRASLFFAGGASAISVCHPAQLAAVDLGSVAGHGVDALWAALRTDDAARLPLDGEVCVRVTDDRDVAAAERALCNRLRADTAASDGPLARLDRRVSLRLSRWLLAHTRLRPNQVTLIGTAVGLTAATLLSAGTYWAGVGGTLLLLCACILDGCDGEIARLKFQDSSFGQKFDVITDNLVHVAVLIGLVVGLSHREPETHHVLLMGVLLGGFALASAMTYPFLARRNRGGASGRLVTASARTRQSTLKALEALINRDFAYLLVLLALIDRLAWFVWGTAVGTYAFAIVLAVAQRWGAGDRGASAAAPVADAGGEDEADTTERRAAPGASELPNRAFRLAERFFLVAGIILLVVLVRELGPSTVLANLTLVGWGIVPIVLQESVAYLANTLGWWAAFPWPRPAIPFGQLLAARIAGDAVNYTTPTATLGGEFVRTRLLRGRAPTTSLVASVAVAKLSQTIGQISFVIIGLAIVIDETPLPAPIQHGLLIGLAAFSALTIALVWAQRRGMFAPLFRLAVRLGLPAVAPQLARSAQHLDNEIARFHDTANGAFAFSVASFMAGWAMGIVEIYLILWFLNVPVTVHRALTIEVLSVAIDGVLFFVPAKAGTQEGGKVLIFTLLGLDPAKGLALGILRRIRELTWSMVGLTILSRHHLSARAVLQARADS
jgi:phosphatidylglycerophosphate synthase/uncharacterized membrane protein YbhN (UPF0104 family)